MIVYVSPHLDDVALSCAGRLVRHSMRGERVTVCTVFTTGSPSRMYAARRRLDQRALAALGHDAIHLGFEDAPTREKLSASYRSLALDVSVSSSLVAQVTVEIQTLCRRVGAQSSLFPLGVGGHVDHRTVFASRSAAGPQARFYEERPYAFMPALRQLRLLELIGGRRTRPPTPTAIAGQVERAACGRLFTEDERDRCYEELAIRLARPHPGDGVALRVTIAHFPFSLLAPAMSVIEEYGDEVRRLMGARSVGAEWAKLAAASKARWFEREYVFEREMGGASTPCNAKS